MNRLMIMAAVVEMDLTACGGKSNAFVTLCDSCEGARHSCIVFGVDKKSI